MALYWGMYGKEVQSAFNHSQGAIGPDSPPDTNLLYTYKFFESYNNLPNTTFIHGLNLYRYCGHYSREGLKAGLRNAQNYFSSVVAFELGNEPEAYPHACIPSDAAPGAKGEPWTIEKYIEDWRAIVQTLLDVFPKGQLIGPSIANSTPSFDAWSAYEYGMDKVPFVKEFASHRQVLRRSTIRDQVAN
jgi:hypothetical protein